MKLKRERREREKEVGMRRRRKFFQILLNPNFISIYDFEMVKMEQVNYVASQLIKLLTR